MKIVINLIFLIFINSISSFALETVCKFEEVYQNGDIQQGILLTEDDKLRYEYYKKNLYTIIRNQGDFYYIENDNIDQFIKIDQNIEILMAIERIADDFPDMKEEYLINDFTIKPVMKLNENFIKKITILSSQMNLNIYFPECNNTSINSKYFFYDPFFIIQKNSYD